MLRALDQGGARLTFLQAEGAVSAWSSFIPFIIVLVVFYFLLIRPQQQQQKKRQEMLASLKKGDKVVTVGGIHGEITEVHDDEVGLRIADKVEIRLSRSGVGRIKGKD